MRERSTSPYRGLALVGVAVLVLSTTAFFRVPLLPDIGRDLEMTAAQLGLITSMFAAGRLLTDLPAGGLLERVRAAGLLSVSATAMLIGSALLALAGGPLTVYLAAFVLGIASAVTPATGRHAFSVAAPRRRRGTALAVFSTALLAGQALGPLAGGTLAASTSWRVALGVAAGICVLLLTALLWSFARGGDGRTPDPDPDAAPANGPGDPARVPLRPGTQSALLFVAFAMFFTLGALPQTLIPLIGSADLGLSVEWIGAALGVGGACRLVGGFVGGVLSDRVSRRAALLPGLLLQALGVALVAGGGVAWWLAGIVVMSLASWSISVGATILADLAPQGRLGPQLGRFRFVGDVGLIHGPMIAAQVYQRAGVTATVAAIAALLVAAALWTGVSVPETRSAAR